jgi:hypothetical protein
MTKGGGALVTPDYKNSPNECNPFTRYGYDTEEGNIVDAEGNTFETDGTLHTHYGIGSDKDNLPDPFPSGITWGAGDLETLSNRTPNKPIMTMGWDGKVYGVFGYYNSNGDLMWNWLKNSGSVKVEEVMKTDIKLQLLMNGVFKLK